MSEFMQIPPTYAVADPQVRSVLDALTRNVQITIDSIQAQTTAVATTAPGGVTTFGSPSNVTNITNLGAAYTPQNLKDDLASGTANVIAGAVNGTTIMKLGTAGEYVVFQHKDAAILGTVGAYTGTVRTGLGITSTGIVGGYNRQSDGAWQSTFAIESATGNLTVLGTIKASSVIEVGALLGTTLVSTVVSNAAAVADKLNKNASDILSGGITFTSAGGFKTGTISIDSSGTVTGEGVAFTSKGIVGRNSSAVTFTIDATTGAATFAGDITSSGKFILSGAGYVYSGGPADKAVAFIDGSSAGYALYVKGGLSTTPAISVDALSSTGIAISASNDYGGTSIFGSTKLSGTGVYGYTSSSTATAVYSDGRFKTSNSSRVVNLYADSARTLVGTTSNELRFVKGTVTGAAAASFLANKPGSASSNVWMEMQIDATTIYIPVWS